MDKITLLLAFLSLPISLFWIVAKANGHWVFKFTFKLFGITCCVLSVIIILKHFNFI